MWESTWGVGIVSLIVAISGSVWSLAWWLNGHFSNIRKDFLSLGKEIIEKLEYHEKHDDQRFAALGNEIWELKLLNAALKGIALNNLPTNPFQKELRQHFESKENN